MRLAKHALYGVDMDRRISFARYREDGSEVHVRVVLAELRCGWLRLEEIELARRKAGDVSVNDGELIELLCELERRANERCARMLAKQSVQK